MSRREGDTFVIEPERPQQCDDCGRIEELRPYGPGGSMVCFNCGMKDPQGAEARFEGRLKGDDIDPAVSSHCGNNPNVRLTDGDRQAINEFRTYLKQRKEIDPR